MASIANRDCTSLIQVVDLAPKSNSFVKLKIVAIRQLLGCLAGIPTMKLKVGAAGSWHERKGRTRDPCWRDPIWWTG
jgi:hypothetical protein